MRLIIQIIDTARAHEHNPDRAPYWIGASICGDDRVTTHGLPGESVDTNNYSQAIEIARLTDLARAVEKFVEEYYSTSRPFVLSRAVNSE